MSRLLDEGPLTQEDDMPSTSKQATAVDPDIPPIQIRSAELADYTVTFETHREDMDPAPLFTGLPDNRCQCPHWGYVTAGAITFHYGDRSETYSAGDAYYAPPGHTP